MHLGRVMVLPKKTDVHIIPNLGHVCGVNSHLQLVLGEFGHVTDREGRPAPVSLAGSAATTQA